MNLAGSDDPSKWWRGFRGGVEVPANERSAFHGPPYFFNKLQCNAAFVFASHRSAFLVYFPTPFWCRVSLFSFLSISSYSTPYVVLIGKHWLPPPPRDVHQTSTSSTSTIFVFVWLTLPFSQSKGVPRHDDKKNVHRRLAPHIPGGAPSQSSRVARTQMTPHPRNRNQGKGDAHTDKASWRIQKDRDLEWIVGETISLCHELKHGIEDCYALLAPIDPGSTLVMSTHRNEKVKGTLTRVGTRIIKGVRIMANLLTSSTLSALPS